MTAPTPQALRIALIYGGRIIEDRTLEAGRKSAVSVGADPKSTFCVPMGELPARLTLFRVTRSGAVLVKGNVCDGRVMVAGADVALAQLPEGDVILATGSKGRVKVGDVTVLFQMVQPVVSQRVLELPRGSRGLVAQLDRAFVMTMVMSFAAHLAGAGYLMAQPPPPESELSLADLQQDRFAAVLMPTPKAPVPSMPEKTKEPIAVSPKKEIQKQEVVAARKPHASTSGAEMRAKLARMGMLGAVGGTEGVFGDLLKDSTQVGNVTEALKNASDLRVASAADALRAGRRGADSGETVSASPMGTDGVKNVVLDDRQTIAVAGRVREETISVDAPDIISPEALGVWMRGRRGAIQSCYERELKRNHSLSGRLVLKFTISSRGRVTGLDVSEGSLHSVAVSDCITSLAKNWVLPFMPEDEVPVAFPFVFSPVN
jgi:hypothetical protein